MLERLRRWRKAFLVPAPEKRPKGKLGLVLNALAATDGASATDLIGLTGWQKPTVHGALSRLRKRGFQVKSRKEDGILIYFLQKGHR